ncbi:MAG: hypothetical protein ACTSV7_09545 [Candidatus Baldrarchaeia archaeon]
MKRLEIFALLSIILLHLTYVWVSYDEQLLIALDYRNSAILFERMLMLFQFIPLVIIIGMKKLSEDKRFLFVAFGICLSTLYIVSDFHYGIYASTINHKYGLIPRMRASAHLMAYDDLGRIAILDFHAEYFLEFVLVHFTSEVTGLNYILVYTFVIRIFSIMSWDIIFLWTNKYLSKKTHRHRRLLLLLLATSMLLANQGYNVEVGFAPLLFLMLYLMIVEERKSYKFTSCAMMITIAILLTSFRETLLVASISLLTISISEAIRRIRPSSPLGQRSSLIVVLLTLSISRMFQFSSKSYIQTYFNKLGSFVSAVLSTLGKELVPRKEFLITIRSIGNPIDQTIGLVSIFSTISVMTSLVILSLLYVLRERDREAFFFSIAVAYILAFSIPVASYLVMIIRGVETLHEFNSATVLARSLAPLVTLAIVSSLIHRKRSKQPFIIKLLKSLVLIYLSFSVVIAPFWILRGDVKSSYDMARVPGDLNERAMGSTYIYYFIASHITQAENIIIINKTRTPVIQFFFIYYILPLKYQLGSDKVIELKTSTCIQFENIYDNGMYTLTRCYSYSSKSFIIDQSGQTK